MPDANNTQPQAPAAAQQERTVTLTVKYLASIMADQHLAGMEEGFKKIGETLAKNSQKTLLPNQQAVAETIYASLNKQLDDVAKQQEATETKPPAQ